MYTVSTQRSRRHAWVTRAYISDNALAHGADPFIRARDFLKAHAVLGDNARAVVVEWNGDALSLTGFRGPVTYPTIERHFGRVTTIRVAGISYPSIDGPQDR